jgi:hypothetical protein
MNFKNDLLTVLLTTHFTLNSVAHHYAFVDVLSDCSVDWTPSHLYHRSPLCMCLCFLKLLCRLNVLLHTSHKCGHSPVCKRWWFITLLMTYCLITHSTWIWSLSRMYAVAEHFIQSFIGLLAPVSYSLITQVQEPLAIGWSGVWIHLNWYMLAVVNGHLHLLELVRREREMRVGGPAAVISWYKYNLVNGTLN